MVNMLPSVLAPFLPIVWVVIACIVWWRNLSAPWLFLAAGLLALFGLQAVVSFVWDNWPLVRGGYFIEQIRTPDQMQRHLEEKNRAALIQAGIVLVAGVALLWWLKDGLASTRP